MCLSCLSWCAAQVLAGVEGGGRTLHFNALRREVALASRFNSDRLVQARWFGCSNTSPPENAVSNDPALHLYIPNEDLG